MPDHGRRDYLKGLAATAASATVLASCITVRPDTVPFTLYQTDEMAQAADDHGVGLPADRGLRAAQSYATAAFKDAYDRAGIEKTPTFHVQEEPVTLEEDRPDVDDLYHDWTAHTDHDPDSYGELLIDNTDPDLWNRDLLGKAQVQDCLDATDHTLAGVVGHGQHLYDVEPEDPVREARYFTWDAATGVYDWNPAARAMQTLIHELGHMHGIKHGDGAVADTEPLDDGRTRYTLTPMVSGFPDAFTEGDEIVLRYRFSDDAVDRVHRHAHCL